MQQPTCVGLRIRTLGEAEVIFHAVHEGLLRMVTRRLDTDERRAISAGCVYVWEERGANAEANGVVSLLRKPRTCPRTHQSKAGHRTMDGFHPVGTQPRERRECESILLILRDPNGISSGVLVLSRTERVRSRFRFYDL